MSGICGIIDLKGKNRIKNKLIIENMINTLLHRGPDKTSYFFSENIAVGISRMDIIGLEESEQPIFNEDGSILLICDGNIFNYVELYKELVLKGHKFRTKFNVEVIIHLYEENRMKFLNQLNGHFAFIIFDLKKQQFFCARDHFGISPFFYTFANEFFIFGSEIKAILKHPDVEKNVDLVGLDQILSFPGYIFPRTMFKNIRSIENGSYLIVKDSNHIKEVKYWDVIYPKFNELNYKNEEYYVEKLDELFTRSVSLRLIADTPVGLYISGGLDSAIIAVKSREIIPGINRHSFSIDFEEKGKSEEKYQRIMSDFIKSVHFKRFFLYSDISERLRKAVYHSECPLKETSNTAFLALSEAAKEKNIKVVLTGEGADVWFAGFPGYKFDKIRQMRGKKATDEMLYENELNERIWGDKDFNFEMNQYAIRKVKKELYSKGMNETFNQFDSLQYKVVNKDMLKDRDMIHKRSYLDYKLRLVLISDHIDRMNYANSVEARYPFLDKELVEFVTTIPPFLKLKDFDEKYILKKVAQNRVPGEIINREKFAFHAPGSPYLLKRDNEYVKDLLSYETIKRQGYFNPDTIEKLKKQYMAEGFTLCLPYETDLLITVLTFGIFLEVFRMQDR